VKIDGFVKSQPVIINKESYILKGLPGNCEMKMPLVNSTQHKQKSGQENADRLFKTNMYLEFRMYD